MRVEPSEKAIKGKKPDAAAQRKIDHITRIVALVVAFISVFFFIIKILFL
jgi:hypothetical protein